MELSVVTVFDWLIVSDIFSSELNNQHLKQTIHINVILVGTRNFIFSRRKMGSIG